MKKIAKTFSILFAVVISLFIVNKVASKEMDKAELLVGTVEKVQTNENITLGIRLVSEMDNLGDFTVEIYVSNPNQVGIAGISSYILINDYMYGTPLCPVEKVNEIKSSGISGSLRSNGDANYFTSNFSNLYSEEIVFVRIKFHLKDTSTYNWLEFTTYDTVVCDECGDDYIHEVSVMNVHNNKICESMELSFNQITEIDNEGYFTIEVVIINPERIGYSAISFDLYINGIAYGGSNKLIQKINEDLATGFTGSLTTRGDANYFTKNDRNINTGYFVVSTITFKLAPGTVLDKLELIIDWPSVSDNEATELAHQVKSLKIFNVNVNEYIEHTITLVTNGGFTLDNEITGLIIQNEPITGREGYVFLGWYDEFDNKVSFPYEITRDETFHAKWEEIVSGPTSMTIALELKSEVDSEGYFTIEAVLYNPLKYDFCAISFMYIVDEIMYQDQSLISKQSEVCGTEFSGGFVPSRNDSNYWTKTGMNTNVEKVLLTTITFKINDLTAQNKIELTIYFSSISDDSVWELEHETIDLIIYL